MTPQETEKIKLMQLFKQGKIDTLPDVNSPEYKLSKIKDMMSKAEGVDEVGGVLNITDPSNPKLTSMEALITNAIAKAYPSAEKKDILDYYNMLMSDVKSGDVSLDGLDLADDFEEFAQENNLNITDPRGGEMAEETIDEGVKWMKRFSGVK